ncbi:DUF938 domain-containing protein [Alteromonas flava]|uniref:DUF938 domain-containing protein n=1 Tax=Alteromonas flava TaxID=2048003 RepID=UPI000C295157|nr:DUF938 domain-containing protein [Alteromonas flava]
MQQELPFSQACENNKAVILEKLNSHFAQARRVLEIGSGTGQHALFFSQNLPNVVWQPTEQPEYLDRLSLRLNAFPQANVRAPLAFSIGLNEWPAEACDAVFTANTAHIMQHDEVKLMMSLIAEHLPLGGVFCQYGPFTQQGQFTSASNQAFHQELLAQGYGGYRDVEELIEWAEPLTLTNMYDMPANNHLLVWQK